MTASFRSIRIKDLCNPEVENISRQGTMQDGSKPISLDKRCLSVMDLIDADTNSSFKTGRRPCAPEVYRKRVSINPSDDPVFTMGSSDYNFKLNVPAFKDVNPDPLVKDSANLKNTHQNFNRCIASPKKSSFLGHPCQRCGRIFSRKADAAKHISVVHDRVKNFLCIICTRRFGRKDYLVVRKELCNKKLI